MSRERLDVALVRRGLASSRTAARRAILDGRVSVTGATVVRPSRRVDPDGELRVAQVTGYVGRGGDKLAAALDRFGIPVEGRAALDVGASTGGFTDCLLGRGAQRVTAVDVGHGQLHPELRSRRDVLSIEGVNIRHADPSALGGPFDLITADLSFISLRLVMESLAAAGGPATDWLVLVKPQFEAGRRAVGKGGLVRDPARHVEAVLGVIAAADRCGLGATGLLASPLAGGDGNREYLLWLRRGPGSVDVSDVTGVVAGATS